MFKTGIVDVPYPDIKKSTGDIYFSEAKAKAVINKIKDVLTNEQDDRAAGLILNFAYYDSMSEYFYLHAAGGITYSGLESGTDELGSYHSITFDGLKDVFDTYNCMTMTCSSCTLKIYVSVEQGASMTLPNVIVYPD
jgi:hypothetical protein